MRPRILIAESAGFSPQAIQELQTVAAVTLADLDRPGLLSAVGEAEVLVARLRHRIDDEVLSAGPHLRILATATTGLNHIDLAAAHRRGIRVLSLQGETDFLKNVHATAEHTIALMLALLRRLPEAVSHARSGGWNRDRFRGRQLQGSIVGVVGYGRLGRIVARLVQAFEARVLAADPHVAAGDVEPGVELVPLPELLQRADLVTLHVNLCPETHGFFGREQLARMKHGARLVNTSRGELIDEEALLAALRCRRLSGAALDVLSGEDSRGMAGHPLVAYACQHDNLIITPHVGGCTVESMAMTEQFLAGKICSAILQPSQE